MQAAGIVPDNHTYGTLLKACEPEARWQSALQLLTSMRAAGLTPNVHCYTAAISVAAAAGRVDIAEQVAQRNRLYCSFLNLKTCDC
jgi:pentatricopeptide repeat protein